MEKIIFEDLPSTNTPINATNLNLLQTNVETAINSVVESGSNDNGSWIKYSDGTLVQYGNVTKSINIKTISNSTGWYYDDGYAIVFPIKFVDTNYFVEVKSALGSLITLNVYSITNYQNSLCEFNLSSNVEYSNSSYKFRWFAIGKWK